MEYFTINTPNGEIEVVRFGDFIVHPFLGSVYIGHPDGSGLTVDEEIIEKALQRVYDENF